MSLSQFFPLERHPQTGEPYIPLLAPHENVIITPARREDVPHMVAILNDAPVKKWLDGPPFPYLDEHAEQWIANAMGTSETVMHELRVADADRPEGPLVPVSGCPVGSLRVVQEDGRETFLGVVEFKRCGFPDMLDPEEQRRLVARNQSRKYGDPEIVWCIGYFLAPAVHRRGLMGEALRRLLEIWVVPRMGARHIRVETVIGNIGSVRVLEKLGFRITNSVRRQKVTSAGVLIEGFHVLQWQMEQAVVERRSQ